MGGRRITRVQWQSVRVPFTGVSCDVRVSVPVRARLRSPKFAEELSYELCCYVAVACRSSMIDFDAFFFLLDCPRGGR